MFKCRTKVISTLPFILRRCPNRGDVNFQAGATLEVKGQKGWTPLHLEAGTNCGKLVVDREPIRMPKDMRSESPLHVAAC